MAPQPVAVYGLQVPVGVLVPANPEFPASFRITMAAIDPTEEPQADSEGNTPAIPRSTLRILKHRIDDIDEDEDEIDEEYMQALLEASQDDDDEDDEEEEANGGPSDPKKKKKGAAQLIEALKKAGEDSDEEMDGAKSNGKSKGKAKATEDDEDEEDDDSEMSDDSEADLEQFLVCTLDTERNYNQPLDIHVNENEKIYFLVSGTHEIYLTGNYVIDDDEDEDDEDDEEDMYDLAGDELLGDDISDDEGDELDDVEDPRVMEVDSDEEEEEAPKLVAKKGKNKRAAEEVDGLDELITKDDKASKKQAKKVKNNKGEAVASEDSKADKKVQFAKNLEQGPTGSAAKAKAAGKGTVGVKVVQGVTVDDRKIGEGRVVKNGDTVGVRYIGKLENGKVFDANKKGKPFSFKAGKGQVIKGWDIGVQGMAIGGERRLTIPAHLAYGSKGLPGIPANSTLQFDIKLLEIK